MQRSVSLSSAEAEYFGATLAAKDLIFIQEILLDLGVLPLDGPSPMYSDSKSAVDMAYDPIAFKKTKHILRAAEFLRDLVAKRVATLHHLKGTVMIADILTKAVARVLFLTLVQLIDSFSSNRESVPPDVVSSRARRALGPGGAVTGQDHDVVVTE